jgi:hypothetical protein
MTISSGQMPQHFTPSNNPEPIFASLSAAAEHDALTLPKIHLLEKNKKGTVAAGF